MGAERTSPRNARTPAVPTRAPRARVDRPAAPPAEPAWNEVANFVLAFESRTSEDGTREHRITAHRMQDGGLSAEWRGVDQHAMYDWVAEHLEGWPSAPIAPLPMPRGAEPAPRSEPVPPLDPQPHALSTAAATSETTASIAPATPSAATHRVRVIALQPHERTQARVPVVDGTRLEIDASISVEPLVDAAVDDVRCRVEFYARDSATAKKVRLGGGVTMQLVPGRTVYTAQLAGATLPAGNYRIACIARLHGGNAPAAGLQTPLWQVVAAA